MVRFSMMLALAITGCSQDETLTGYGAAAHGWQLSELNGARFTARATLEFPEPGELVGQAPCNRYFGTQNAPYPWFKAENIGATRMACPDLGQEQVFLQALTNMTQAEVQGQTLILSNEDGGEMVFTARPAQPNE